MFFEKRGKEEKREMCRSCDKFLPISYIFLALDVKKRRQATRLVVAPSFDAVANGQAPIPSHFGPPATCWDGRLLSFRSFLFISRKKIDKRQPKRPSVVVTSHPKNSDRPTNCGRFFEFYLVVVFFFSFWRERLKSRIVPLPLSCLPLPHPLVAAYRSTLQSGWNDDDRLVL